MPNTKFLAIISLLLFSIASYSKILVHGHRGARSIYPENSIKAFEYALEIGVDVLELDLGITKDGVLVINHEPYIDSARCTHPSRDFKDYYFIHNLNFKEVQEFDCGSKVHPRFPKQKQIKNTKIPSLEELFVLVQKWEKTNKKKIEFNMETKLQPRYANITASPEDFAKKILELLKKYAYEERTIIQSFDYRSLVAIKNLNPRIRTSFLNYESLPEYTSLMKGIKADILSPNLNWITKDDVVKLHAIGLQVAPWTANKEEDWQYLVDIGVDAIITDDPKALIDFLKEKKLR